MDQQKVRALVSGSMLGPNTVRLLSRSLVKFTQTVLWAHPLVVERLHAVWVKRTQHSCWALERLAHHLHGWSEACLSLPSVKPECPNEEEASRDMNQCGTVKREPSVAEHTSVSLTSRWESCASPLSSAPSWNESTEETFDLLRQLDRTHVTARGVKVQFYAIIFE